MDLLLKSISEEVFVKLLDSVKSQSVADVPIAALLSGGIDSSLVVSAFCLSTGRSLNTFNVKFPDTQYDETQYARAVADYYSTNHKVIDFENSTVDCDEIVKLLGHFDQPFADTSFIPVFKICKAIRTHGIICTLSGDGGDEVFGGYERFWRANKLYFIMKLPRLIQDILKNIGQVCQPFTRDFGRQLHKAVELAQNGRNNYALMLSGMCNFLNDNQKDELLVDESKDVYKYVSRFFIYETCPPRVDLEQFSNIMTENLFRFGLVSDMLHKVDMMSMLSGVEVRVPMLDEELVTIGLQLPHYLKTNGREGKLVLKEIARQRLPRTVLKHNKWGFGIPLDKMVDKRFYQMLGDMFLCSDSKTASFLNSRIIKKWIDLFINAGKNKFQGEVSRGGVYQRIAIILALELWLRKNKLSW